ncbi:dynein regulatory complex subunit 7, partial [Biomphalaria pfeifferi]
SLNYDIGDSRHWEYVFAGQDLHIHYTADEARHKKTVLALLGDSCPDELFLDLPMSWCLPLKISRDDYDRKYPTGKRSRRYKYTILEDFCRYLNPDGMVRKLYVYSNLACTDISYTICYFADRSDHLESRFFHQHTGKIIEKFSEGRDDFLLEHHYYAFRIESENSRLMIFTEGKRTDELYRREEDANYIRSYYKNRSDRKTFKESRFGPEGRILESPKILLPNPRPIEAIIETFERNPNVPANSDIAMVTFNLATDEIEIEYHVDDNSIFGSTRHFTKPPNWWDETQVLNWSPELHSSFEANYLTKPKSELELYEMLIGLMKMESKTRDMTRMVEKEIRHILKVRNREEEKLELVRTYVQADRDQALREVRLKLKAQGKAARYLSKQDILRDYLEPFMHRVGLDEITNKKQAVRETKIIENSQKMYHEQFTTLSSAEVQEYKSYLLQHMFIAHILEQRLVNLKEYAPFKYQELYDRMLKDKRLEPFLI